MLALVPGKQLFRHIDLVVKVAGTKRAWARWNLREQEVFGVGSRQCVPDTKLAFAPALTRRSFTP